MIFEQDINSRRLSYDRPILVYNANSSFFSSAFSLLLKKRYSLLVFEDHSVCTRVSE